MVGLKKLKHSDADYNLCLERNSNVYLRFTIFIEEVLKHSAIDKLFIRLQKKGKIDKSLKIEKRLDILIDNYKKKNNIDHSIEQIEFYIKNRNLRKNGEIDSYDIMFHEIEIPYSLKKGEETFREETFKESIQGLLDIGFSIKIRMLIVNGEILLQVGKFDSENTPKVIRDRNVGPQVYKTYSTITKFPLMYFSFEHKIPKKFLNISIYGTDMWKHHLSLNSNNKKDSNDWLSLQDDIKSYNYVCATAADESVSYYKKKKQLTILDKKKDEKLKKYRFQDQSYSNDYNSSRECNKIHYKNKYLSVYCIDNNELNEERQRFDLTDYHEESITSSFVSLLNK